MKNKFCLVSNLSHIPVFFLQYLLQFCVTLHMHKGFFVSVRLGAMTPEPWNRAILTLLSLEFTVIHHFRAEGAR